MENQITPLNFMEKLRNSAILIAEIKKLRDANPTADFSDIIKEAKIIAEQKIG